LTLAPGLTWSNYGGDGAELITAAATLGIPHPPGYPVYILIGKLISLIPIGTVAYRFNYISALWLALSTGFLTSTVTTLLVREQYGKRVVPLVPISVGLMFAFLPLVWGQALIAEVYSLNLFLISTLVWLLVQEISGKKSYIAGIIFGLSLTTHLTSLFVLPLSLYLLPKKQWHRFAIGILIGIIPILLLPMLGSSSSPVIWGRPNTLSGWIWLVTAQIYRPNVLSLAAQDYWARITEWFSEGLWQMLLLGVPLIVVGFVGARAKDRRLITALLATASLYAVYAFGYRTNDAIVFVLPGILIFSASLGFGMKRLGKVSFLLPVFLLALNFGGQNLGDDLSVRNTAEREMKSLPKNAIVITPGDQTATTLLYYQYVEGLRPDLVVVDDTMFQFDWYRERLSTLHPFLVQLENDDVPGFVEGNLNTRSVCHVGLVSSPGSICVHPPEEKL
jgi:multisubunit Na+/H+ antiporter MnhE subunit